MAVHSQVVDLAVREASDLEFTAPQFLQAAAFSCAKVQLIVSPNVVDAFCEPEAPVIASVYCPAVTELPAVRLNVLTIVAGFAKTMPSRHSADPRRPAAPCH